MSMSITPASPATSNSVARSHPLIDSPGGGHVEKSARGVLDRPGSFILDAAVLAIFISANWPSKMAF